MTLEKAYKIGLKYGFAFNGIGPSLSVIDDKVGICINLLDDNFGYIKRNYVFDDEKEFEEFLKKYNYYLYNRKDKNFYLTLDNYETPDPKINYSFEREESKKKEIAEKNKELLIIDMQSFLKNFVDSLDGVRSALTEKILIEQDYYNKLQYYKDLLCKAYDIENEDEPMSADRGEIDSLNEKIKEFDLSHKRELSSLDPNALSDEQLKETYDKLFQTCKSFLEQDSIVEIMYNRLKFNDSIETLDKMIDYLINNPKADDNTEEKLNSIKESATPIPEFDEYKNEYEKEYLASYQDVTDCYNEKVFGALKIEFINETEDNVESNKDINSLKDLFDSLNDDQKNAVQLIQSPLRPIILYIIEQAYYKNKKLLFDRDDFRKVYESLNKTLKDSKNLVFKIKYFKSINFSSFDEFIKSVVKITKTICSSYLALPYNLKLYSLNFDACMICASDSPIKSGSEVVNVINAGKGCNFLYSPTKIVYDKDENQLSIDSNKNVIYFPRYLNELTKQKDTIKLNIYNESYSVDKVKAKNLLIIDKFSLDKTIKYKFSDMTPKQKNN